MVYGVETIAHGWTSNGLVCSGMGVLVDGLALCVFVYGGVGVDLHVVVVAVVVDVEVGGHGCGADVVDGGGGREEGGMIVGDE